MASISLEREVHNTCKARQLEVCSAGRLLQHKTSKKKSGISWHTHWYANLTAKNFEKGIHVRCYFSLKRQRGWPVTFHCIVKWLRDDLNWLLGEFWGHLNTSARDLDAMLCWIWQGNSRGSVKARECVALVVFHVTWNEAHGCFLGLTEDPKEALNFSYMFFSSRHIIPKFEILDDRISFAEGRHRFWELTHPFY